MSRRRHLNGCNCGGSCGSTPMNGIFQDIGSILAPRNPDGTVAPMATIATEVYMPMSELFKIGAFTIATAYLIKKIK